MLCYLQTAFAGLEWEKQILEFHPKLEDKQATAVFRFTNSGTKDLTIKEVSHTCGCLLSKAETRSYKPGEKGEVIGTFIFENRIGLHEQKIEVITDDQACRKVTLTIKAYIPELYHVKPKFVYWKQGEMPSVKKIKIVKEVDKEIKLGEVTVSNAHFKVDLIPIVAGKEYELQVSPTKTDRDIKAIISIATDWVVENKGAKIINCYAYIK